MGKAVLSIHARTNYSINKEQERRKRKKEKKKNEGLSTSNGLELEHPPASKHQLAMAPS